MTENMVLDDIQDAGPSGSGGSSPFVHPDRQMSITNSSTPGMNSGPGDREVPSKDTENSGRDEPKGSEPATKRQRTMGSEEKKRGLRLFGNLLGTLNRFTKEEKSKAASDRAKARQEVAARVANKLQGESQRVHEINEREREAKSARIEFERVQNTLREAEMEAKVKARHLPYVSGFLLTSSSWINKANGQGALITALGPARDAGMAANPKPLYYRPRRLLPEQEDILDEQEKKARDIIEQDEIALRRLRTETEEKLASLTEKRKNAQEKLDGFRQQDQDKKIENLAKSMDVDQGEAPSITIKGEGEEMSGEGKTATDNVAAEDTKPVTEETDMEVGADDAGRGGREGDEVEY